MGKLEYVCAECTADNGLQRAMSSLKNYKNAQKSQSQCHAADFQKRPLAWLYLATSAFSYVLLVCQPIRLLPVGLECPPWVGAEQVCGFIDYPATGVSVCARCFVESGILCFQ